MTYVLGFLVQCEVCPQQALLEQQPADSWMCPRCSSAGFGDVDVAQGEPLQEMRAADARVGRQLVDFAGRRLKSLPRSLTTLIDDPLAVAICAEVQRHPNNPMITAVVNGATFAMRSCTQREGQPFETEWVGEVDLRAMSTLPVVQFSQPVIADNEPEGRELTKVINAELRAEVDGPDLGKIRG